MTALQIAIQESEQQRKATLVQVALFEKAEPKIVENGGGVGKH